MSVRTLLGKMLTALKTTRLNTKWVVTKVENLYRLPCSVLNEMSNTRFDEEGIEHVVEIVGNMPGRRDARKIFWAHYTEFYVRIAQF